MKVKELIRKLQTFSKENKNGGDLEIHIIDGHQGSHYHGDFEIALFQDDALTEPTCDIGVGGMRV